MDKKEYTYTCTKCRREWKTDLLYYGLMHVCDPCFEIINAEREAERAAKVEKPKQKKLLKETC